MCKVGQFKSECFHITCWQLLEMPPLSLPAQRLNSFLDSSELFHHSLSIARRRASHKHDLVLSVWIIYSKQCLSWNHWTFYLVSFLIRSLLFSQCMIFSDLVSNFPRVTVMACRDTENNALSLNQSARKSSYDLQLFFFLTYSLSNLSQFSFQLQNLVYVFQFPKRVNKKATMSNLISIK